MCRAGVHTAALEKVIAASTQVMRDLLLRDCFEVFSHCLWPFQVWEFEVCYLPSTVECIALLAKVYTTSCSLS